MLGISGFTVQFAINTLSCVGLEAYLMLENS